MCFIRMDECGTAWKGWIMKHKLNDGGFSLVEVVLSMAILAIISIPLLNYFSDSMKYNAKMAQKQHATALAQEVLEGMKNENHLVQEVTPAAVSGTAYSVPSLTGKGYTEISNDMEVVSGSAVSGSAVYLGDGIMIGKNYDVVVKVNCSTPENEKDVAQVAAINADTDVFAAENGQANEAVTKFMAVNASANTISPAAVTLLTGDQIKAAMKRTMKIDISKEALPGTEYKVEVTCSYSCSGLKGTTGTDEYFECSPFAEKKLSDVKKIYLLFSKEANDNLEISVQSGIFPSGYLPEFYLICQNLDPAGTGDLLNITAKYSDSTTISGAMLGNNIVTNIGKNSNHNVIKADGVPVTISAANNIVDYAPQTRKVNLEVSVYKKGTGNTLGAEPYITVNASKGE